MGRILVVEPYDEIRKLLVTALRHSGHEVETVAHPADALDLIGAGRYGCTVIGSPVALEPEPGSKLLLEALEDSFEECCRSVIVLTTHVQDLKILALAARLDVYAVLAKPFAHRDLEQAVTGCLRGDEPPTRWIGIPEELVGEALSHAHGG